MPQKSFILLFLIGFFWSLKAQNTDLIIKSEQELQLTSPKEFNPLSPAKAAFYSAILPGAGQIYNNRYWWQLPAMYIGFGISGYYYNVNRLDYQRFRKAYKLRKAGLKDEFTDVYGNELISEAGLQRAQNQTRKNRDTSLMMIILVYILQITEASVRAHLLEFDTTNDLSISPVSIPNDSFQKEIPKVGLSIKYNF